MRELVFRDLNSLLEYSHPYVDRFKTCLASFHEGLWEHIEITPTLDHNVGLNVIAYLLELSCECQNILNIELGRAGLIALPRPWLSENILTVAKTNLNLQDDWEYRRLLEIVWRLDRSVVIELTEFGRLSPKMSIREVAEESKYELENQ